MLILAQAVRQFDWSIGSIAIAIVIIALNVCPSAIADDAPYRVKSHPEFSREIFDRDPAKCISPPNLDNLRFGQLARSSLFAFRASPLCNLVSNIVAVRSEKQMVGVDTRRIVTAVKNFHVAGNWSVFQFIGNPVGVFIAAVFPASPDAKESVAVLIDGPGPKNAAGWRGLSKATCELNFHRNPSANTRIVVALGGAEFSWPVVGGLLKELAALPASVGNSDSLSFRHVGPPDRFGMFRAGWQLKSAVPLVSLYSK